MYHSPPHALSPPARDGCDLSIIVATYNERERIEELVASITAILAGGWIDGEPVIVDDNSPDGQSPRPPSMPSSWK